MGPDHVAGEVGLSLDRAVAVIRELEERMTFLFRNEEGEVVWACPITVEETPHRLTFSTGEKIFGA
jgi:hypothetical protein